MNNYVVTLSVIDKLKEWSDKFKDFIMNNYGNPILWVAILVFGILLYKVLYSGLNKNG